MDKTLSAVLTKVVPPEMLLLVRVSNHAIDRGINLIPGHGHTTGHGAASGLGAGAVGAGAGLAGAGAGAAIAGQYAGSGTNDALTGQSRSPCSPVLEYADGQVTLETPAKVLDLSVKTRATMLELLVLAPLLVVLPALQLELASSEMVLDLRVALVGITLPTPTRLAPDTSSPLPTPTLSRKEKLPVISVTPTMTSLEGVRSPCGSMSRS